MAPFPKRAKGGTGWIALLPVALGYALFYVILRLGHVVVHYDNVLRPEVTTTYTLASPTLARLLNVVYCPAMLLETVVRHYDSWEYYWRSWLEPWDTEPGS